MFRVGLFPRIGRGEPKNPFELERPHKSETEISQEYYRISQNRGTGQLFKI